VIEFQAQAARDLVETLHRGGVRDAVISPGSRNTPLVLAAESLPGLRKTVVLDERVAGFVALGLSRTTARPPLLICTSGTAAAHYLPALLEADASRLPMIVLSAARPQELDHCGAPQSLNQAPLFESYTRLSQQLPLADECGAKAWCSAAVSALSACWGSPEGPVHLNLPFREPLWQPGLVTQPCLGPEFLPSLPMPDIQALPNLAMRLSGKRGLIVCGPSHGCRPYDDRLAAGVRRLANALGWPVLCEPASRLRGKLGDHEIAFGDRLHAAGFFAQHNPEATLQVGSAPTSKSLRGWLDSLSGPHFLVDRDGLWRDPNHRAGLLVSGDETAALECLATAVGDAVEGAWLAAWRGADQAAQTALDHQGWSEAQVLRLALDQTDAVQVANSLPIRHIEGYIGASECPEVLLANRGLNGIDGTLSSAIGVQIALQRNVVVVLGDLALGHDLAGLAQAAQSSADLAILVIDNGGGGIFRRLPIADNEAVFERYFETPQGLDFKRLAQGLSLPCWQVSHVEELLEALPAWRQSKGTRLLIAKVDSESDRAWRAEIDHRLATVIQEGL
jgi:2-succinyl-5-enolpyruvyl-6-hydroxy-3-cyclohexene-1-carboxylate synthase